MTAATEPPKQPYILLFEGGDSEGLPLAVSIGERGAVPLFDSREKAGVFTGSAGFGDEFFPVEVSTSGLVSTLEAVKEQIEYVAINPPPKSESGMKVRMGGLEELIKALRDGSDEVDLFDFLGENGAGR